MTNPTNQIKQNQIEIDKLFAKIKALEKASLEKKAQDTKTVESIDLMEFFKNFQK